MIRAKTTWAQEGEKNTAYFIGFEKSNYKNRLMTKLIDSQNQKITDPTKVLEFEQNYYKNVYQHQSYDSTQSKNFLTNENIPKINANESNMCDEDLTLYEFKKP